MGGVTAAPIYAEVGSGPAYAAAGFDQLSRALPPAAATVGPPHGILADFLGTSPSSDLTRIGMDAVDEELKRWIERAKAGLAQLPPGSPQQRDWARAVRRMTLTQLRHRINRAHDELRRLPGGLDERQELERAVEQMDEEYRVELRETLSTHQVETEDRTLAEVRKTLAQASRLLMPPTAQARLRDAIEETERALTRLKEYHGRTVE
jgi:2-succinyl-5-enolpyruvyl-6-hydroxy-3-cyclohexene-1-carboxylate synthase